MSALCVLNKIMLISSQDEHFLFNRKAQEYASRAFLMVGGIIAGYRVTRYLAMTLAVPCSMRTK